MNGRPQKRSFSIKGHRTSISLEPQFWEALKSAASEERVSLSALINRIDSARANSELSAGLSSAVRVWLLERLQSKVTETHPETA